MEPGDAGPDVELVDGETDRVEAGGLTAIESLLDAAEVTPPIPPVRRVAKAARRGRGAAVGLLALAVAVVVGALMLIRAASWLREGRRLAFGCFVGGAMVVVVVVAVVVAVAVEVDEEMEL